MSYEYDFYEGKEPILKENENFTDPYFEINDTSIFGKMDDNWTEEQKKEYKEKKENYKV